MFRAIGEKGLVGGRNSSETKFLLSEGPTPLKEEGDTGKTDRQRTAHQFEPLRK